MLNKVILMGRLVRDPELRTTNTGTAVASFTLAVERDFTKGRMAVVDGRLESRKWVDRDGRNRTSWTVVAGNVYFGDSRPAAPSEDNAPEGELPREQEAEFQEVDDDGELPF